MPIILIRHGETDWNREQRVQGLQDSHVTEAGKQQMNQAIQRLVESHGCQPSRILSSPLKRAHESALICQAAFNVTLELSSDWRERSFGLLEGKTVDEIRLIYQLDDFEGIQDEQLGVESMELVRARILCALAELQTSEPDAMILIVTHGSIMKCVMQLYGLTGRIPANAEFWQLPASKLTYITT